MTHLTKQSKRPAQSVLFFFIESFEAQDNSGQSGQIPIGEIPKIPTLRLRLKIALFFRNCNSVNLRNAAIKPRQTFSMTTVIVLLNAAVDDFGPIFSGDVALAALDI
ncbi:MULTISPECIES: hypothetical protein [Pandoraea]|uniref:hypothetical protein n=1 Tax=Pandoraea TaxID=93217 RepID=UPI0011AB5FEA|nr:MULTISPECIES: hypothetical protein [Pandoraea]